MTLTDSGNKKEAAFANLVDVGFRAAVLCKGLGGAFQIAASLLLLCLNPVRMERLLAYLALHLFSHWRPAADMLLRFGTHFSRGVQLFGVLYLLSHGIIKCVLMVLLWRGKWWAYLLAILSISVFIAYQVVRICIRPTLPMIALTVFDAAMIALTAAEYRQVRQRARSKNT